LNFDLGPDELALRDGIRELCARRFPMDKVRAGFDRAGWRDLGEAGVFSLRLPEADGGVGLGMTEAVIVFQELGRALVPGPLVASHLAAGLVDGAATGERVATVIDGSDLVPFAAESDAAIDIGDRASLVEGPLEGEDVVPLDPLTPARRISAPKAGRTVDAHAGTLRRTGAVLTAALASGIASRTVDLAVDYAKERTQFDRPIGSFQAVKHLCADMFVRAEVARAAVDAAGVAFDEGGDVSAAVATAKLLACEAAIANGKACVQVHGGMGFTWEVDAHLYLKRAAVLATQFGGIDEQASVVAGYLS
jgi:alkylation response protein AidB-like acyl-CoA dehydrogenase